jgi:alpha-1,2-mannosyltransferase
VLKSIFVLRNLVGMKVALIHFSLNFVGGAEKLCLTTISALKNAGHTVTLVTIEKTDWKMVQETFAKYAMPDKELYLYSAKLSKRLSNPILAVILFAGYLFEHVFIKMMGKYDVTLSTFGDLVYSMVDVVYVHAPLKASDKLSQILPITTASKWRFQSKLYDLSLMIFNQIPARVMLVNSTFIKHVVADSLKVNAHVLSPPVDVKFFWRSDENGLRKNEIVTLSGYSPKRHLERLPNIASFTKSGKFVIIGKTDKYSSATIQNLRAIIKKYKLEDRVELLLNVPRLKLREVLSEAKIYLHTMPNEHFGTAIVESMASGCVPIVHKSGGPWFDILEQKQGKYGYAYETLDEASAYIDLLLREEDLRRKTASRAVMRSLNYDSSIFARKIVKIVEIVHQSWKAWKKNKFS